MTRGGLDGIHAVSLTEIRPSLEPRLAELLARHKAAAARVDWSYHDFLPLDARRGDPRRRRRLSRPAYVAVETALLTEANLPWYAAVLSEGLRGSPPPIQEFVRIWTSEEDRHATLLETYLLLSDNGDHAERARTRKTMLAGGWTTDLRNPFDGMVYTAIQELATRAFYLHAARVCEREDPALVRALQRIARDEALHYAFYRDVVKAHLDADPAYVEPLARVLMAFEMPGYVIPDFKERSAYLASEHVFGPQEFCDDVVEALWSYWGLDRLAPQRTEARRAQRHLRAYRAALRRLVARASHDVPRRTSAGG